MKPFVVGTTLLFASALGAQQQQAPDTSYDARHPSWTNSLEVGLYPTARHYTPDVGYGGLWGGGFTGTMGYQFAPIAAVEVGYSDTWNPDIVSYDRAHPETQLATGSLVLQGWTHAPVIPYVSGGIGYNWFQFHLPSTIYPALTDIRDKGFWVWHPAAGIKFKLSYATALRAEANMDVTQHRRASAGGFLGLSFFPGARRPAPRVFTRYVEMPPPRPVHDTTVVTRVDTVRIAQAPVERTVVDTSVLLVVQDVNFGFGRSTLRPRAAPILARAAQQLNMLPSVPITIEGFTDSIGSDSFNYKLGLARAQSVRDFLVRSGVNPNRITVASGGKTDPVASNRTAYGRALNRRVVIRKNVTTSTPPNGR
jgi:outer membrane protein OmpA-like peptidoglycan-associated protein